MLAGLLLGIDLIISFIAVVSREDRGRGNGEHGEHRVSRSIGIFTMIMFNYK